MNKPEDFEIENGVLKAYNGNSAVVEIPEGVTKIGNSAFYMKILINRVVIPSSVSVIDNFAFHYCKRLQSVIIPQGVTEIGTAAFYSCSSLTAIEIPGSVEKIGTGAFGDCQSLRRVELNEGTICIGDNAFSKCIKLNSINIPNSVTEIGSYAFYCCSWLERITIPESVTQIGDFAFQECEKLVNFEVQGREVSIGKGFLYGCRGLCNQDGYIVFRGGIYGYFGNRTRIVVPEGITRIGYMAFGYSDITSISLPKSLRIIEKFAFLLSDRMERVDLKEGLEIIDEGAFFNCKVLEDIYIPRSVKYIGKEAFCNCQSIGSVTIPEGLETIGERAFAKCRALRTLTLPEREIKIGNGAFSSCRGLKNKEGFTIIREVLYNYYGTKNEVIIPESVKVIDVNAISNRKNLTHISINHGVKRIKKRAFQNNKELKSIELPSSITNIEEGAFEGSDNIYEFHFPKEGIPHLDIDESKKNRKSLNRQLYIRIYLYGNRTNNAELDKHCERIIKRDVAEYAGQIIENHSIEAMKKLLKCYKKPSIELMDKLIQIAHEKNNVEMQNMLMSYKNSIYTEKQIEKIKNDKVEKALGFKEYTMSEWRRIYSFEVKDGTVKIKSYRGEDTVVVVPEKIGKHIVTSIGDYAFSPKAPRLKAENRKTREELSKVKLPATVETLGEGVFYNCPKLTVIVPENSVTENTIQNTGMPYKKQDDLE